MYSCFRKESCQQQGGLQHLSSYRWFLLLLPAIAEQQLMKRGNNENNYKPVILIYRMSQKYVVHYAEPDSTKNMSKMYRNSFLISI